MCGFVAGTRGQEDDTAAPAKGHEPLVRVRVNPTPNPNPNPNPNQVTSQFDSSNFDNYDEDEGIQNYPNSNFPKKMFEEFASVWVGN